LRNTQLIGNPLLPSLIAFIASEHLLVLFKQAIAASVSDVPESVLVRQRRQDYIVNTLIWDMDVEDISNEDVDHSEGFVDEQADQEASARNVMEHYQLDRIPTTFKIGMQAVSGKEAYGEVRADASV